MCCPKANRGHFPTTGRWEMCGRQIYHTCTAPGIKALNGRGSSTKGPIPRPRLFSYSCLKGTSPAPFHALYRQNRLGWPPLHIKRYRGGGGGTGHTTADLDPSESHTQKARLSLLTAQNNYRKASSGAHALASFLSRVLIASAVAAEALSLIPSLCPRPVLSSRKAQFTARQPSIRVGANSAKLNRVMWCPPSSIQDRICPILLVVSFREGCAS